MTIEPLTTRSLHQPSRDWLITLVMVLVGLGLFVGLPFAWEWSKPLWLVPQLFARQDNARRAALLTVARFDVSSRRMLIPILVKVLRAHQDARIRCDAVEALDAMGLDVPHVVPVLCGVLHDVDMTIRVTAIKALGRRGPTVAPRSVPART